MRMRPKIWMNPNRIWMYPKGEAKIQRHVPALPLSRDLERMLELQKSLVVTDFLMSRLGEEDMDILRIDLSPPKI